MQSDNTYVCSSISALLSDDKYIPLRTALEQNGVDTIDKLKEIKLWPFMNQHNIYSIAMRHSILTEVQKALLEFKSDNSLPLYNLVVDDTEYLGDSPSKAFAMLCEEMAKKYPLRIRGLVDKEMAKGKPAALTRQKRIGDIGLENITAFVDGELTAEQSAKYAGWLVSSCVGNQPDIQIFNAESGENLLSCCKINDISDCTDDISTTKHLAVPSCMLKKAEEIILNADIDGITYAQLRDGLNESMHTTKELVKCITKAIDMEKYILHEDALIDWDEGAQKLDSIIDKLMSKNNGYIASAQLYEYARSELKIFLNDNDIDDERSVYNIAQHMFEKNAYNGRRYSFVSKSHISRIDASISTNFDIFRKFALDNGGFFEFDSLVEHLKSIGIKTGNIQGQMRIYTEPSFMYYDDGVLLVSECLNIDEEWKNTIKIALNKLFDDVGDHIVFRDIQSFWYDRLPSLPGARRWTPLLLQSVLKFYGEELGAHTISALDSQSLETIHAMLVSNEGNIQNFGDAVICCLVENDIDERAFDAEDLRAVLVQYKLIRGGELVNNLSKALGNDERFAWDIQGKRVSIKV